MFIYYLMLIIGALFVVTAVVGIIISYRRKNYSLLKLCKYLGSFLLGVLILVVTLPSLKYVVLKEYDVVSGKCVIEIDSAGRSSLADFEMFNTNEMFSFNEIPKLDAYGKSVPYYCKVTVTKDHMVEIGYKIYDEKTRRLILTNK